MQNSLAERIRDRVEYDTNGGCWLWARACFDSGYGAFRHDKKMRRAHQLSYEAFVGPRNGLCTLHTCDTPACVNPDHLFLGTHAVNGADKARKRRGAEKTRNGNHKLSDADVAEIRRLLPYCSQAFLGRQFGVTRQAVWAIAHEGTWRP